MQAVANDMLGHNHATDAGRCLNLAYTILDQKGLDVSEVIFHTFDDEVLYQIKVCADVDQITELNFELADTLVDAELVPKINSSVTVMFISDFSIR